MSEAIASLGLIEWTIGLLVAALTAGIGHLHIRISAMEADLKRNIDANESEARREIEEVQQRAHELTSIVQREMLPRADFQAWRAELREEMRGMEDRLLAALTEGRARMRA